MKFRYLTTGFHTAAENMAIDDAVLGEVAAGTSLPTLRLYGWKPAAISIGYFQSLDDEVDLVACKKFGVDYVRRITGGGAVFHEHEITYSIHIPEKLAIVPNGILESYKVICDGVIRGLSKIGVSAIFAPINDLIVMKNGAPRKISGNAQTRKKGVILQHGTILLKVNVDKMFSLLKVPDEKLKGKLIDDVKQRVTSLSDFVGRDVTYEEGREILRKGFEESFATHEFVEQELSSIEQSLIPSLLSTIYGNSSWNHKR